MPDSNSANVSNDALVKPGAHRSLPLSGIRVIDLTRIYSGPYCSFLMAMAGADVIKIEPPDGDSLRKRDGNKAASFPFALLNANKRFMTLNLKSSAGVDLLLGLVRTADVLLENFRPGVMDRLGLTKARLLEANPKLIIGRTSGFGSEGPYRDFPAMDLTVQALVGIMDSTGFPENPPVKSGPAVVDFAAGTHLFGSICAALFARERTGQVLSPEVSMMEAAYPTLVSNLALAMQSRDDYLPRTGNRHGGLSLAPYNVYPASDGFVAIICNNERHWSALTRALNRPDWASDRKYNAMTERVRRMDQLDADVAVETRKFTRQELFERLNKEGAACAPVRTLREVLADPQLRQRNMLQDLDHPEYGKLVVMGSPLRFDELEQAPYRPSGALGSDNDGILQSELDLSADDIAKLRANGVI